MAKWTTSEMIAHLKRQGVTVTPPAQTQRKTQALSESYADLHEEPSYETDPLKGSLHPSRWKALANPRTVWPQDLDPNMVLREMSSLLCYRILDQDAGNRGLTVQQAYGLHPYDEV